MNNHKFLAEEIVTIYPAVSDGGVIRVNGPDKSLKSPAAKAKITLLAGTSLKPQPIDWLWRDWLAKGKFHLFAGQPGGGKTTIAMVWAAIITQGGRWPDGSRAPIGNVIVWSGEDDPSDTLLPRLKAAGGDPDKVYFVGDWHSGDKTRPFDPATDIEPLREAIERVGGCSLIIVDPVISAVAGDSHKNAEVRRSLQPLVDLAAACGAALIGISHLSKGGQGREPIERLSGSIAFVALARVVLLAAKEAEGEDGAAPRRFICRAKSNIGPDDGGFVYDISQVPMPGDDRIIASIATFGEAIEGSARKMLAACEDVSDEGDRSAIQEAQDFLRDVLSDGSRPVKEIAKEAKSAGVAERTLRRAKDRLGVTAIKTSISGGWEWCLPNNQGGQTPPSWSGGRLAENREKLGHLRRSSSEDKSILKGGHKKPGNLEGCQSGKTGNIGHLGQDDADDTVSDSDHVFDADGGLTL